MFQRNHNYEFRRLSPSPVPPPAVPKAKEDEINDGDEGKVNSDEGKVNSDEGKVNSDDEVNENTTADFREYKRRYYYRSARRYKNSICSNCSGKGHFFKDCKKPIQSFGLLAWTLLPRANCVGRATIPAVGDPDFLASMRQLYATGTHDLAVCLIQRRHTISFEAFVRGKYNGPDELLIHRDRMTIEERAHIRDKSWDELYEYVMADKELQYMQRERKRAKSLYDEIEDVRSFLQGATTAFNEPSWEFPKGRRYSHEKDKDCALREFEEETNIPIADVHAFDTICEEEFCGTNQRMYRNKYYLGLVHPDNPGPFVDPTSASQISEVGNVRWFSLQDALNILRPFYHEKRAALQKSFDEIINVLLLPPPPS